MDGNRRSGPVYRRIAYVMLIVVSCCISTGCGTVKYLPHSLKSDGMDQSRLAVIDWDGSWKKKYILICIDGYRTTTSAQYHLLPGQHLITYYSKGVEIRQDKVGAFNRTLVIKKAILQSKIFDAERGAKYRWDQVVSDLDSKTVEWTSTQLGTNYPEYDCASIYKEHEG